MIREIRLHLQYAGALRRVAKVFFSRADASIYLVPYSLQGEYFYGSRSLADKQASDTFGFREQLSSRSNPKLSIHESGQVHIYAGGRPRTETLQITPLRDLRGEHVATIQWDSINSLCAYCKSPKGTPPDIDCAFGVPKGVDGGALLIFANGQASCFRTEVVHLPVAVPSREGHSIFFGVTAVAKESFPERGVTTLAGFDPGRTSQGGADSFVFLRGL